MKLLIALCFFILGTIQLGLLFGVFHYYRSRNLLQVNPYWLGSLAASVIALFTFGIGAFFVNNLIEPPFSFTIANTGFYIAGVLQLLFCQSLISRIRKIHLVFFGVSTLIFFATFEYCRINASYEARVVLMCIVGIFFYCWQIYSLSRIRKKSPSSQLGY